MSNERGISKSVLDRFEIGYVPLRVNHRCAGRVIFPIKDPYGELIAISTRHFHKKKTDPYYFWHESFDKAFFLYGMHLAKNSMFKFEKSILVEGELDVLALHSEGVEIAVGVCGSSFSVFQASVLERYSQEIYLLFDGDQSGKNSMKRAVRMGKEHSISNMIPCYLTKNCDPDDYVKEHGREGIISLMKNSKQYKSESEMTG